MRRAASIITDTQQELISVVVMGRQENGGSGGRQVNKPWSLIHGPRFLTILLVISMIHVATSQDKMSTLDQGSNIIRSPRYAKTTRKTNTQSSRVCNTNECIDAADDIKSSMNLTVEPCDDFYEFACGNWSFRNPFPNGSTFYHVFEKVYFRTEGYKKRKLESGTIEIKGLSRNVQQLPSHLYKSCINLTAIEHFGAAPLRKRIKELGGWSMSGTWDEDSWDFNRALLSHHKIEDGGPIFYVEFKSMGNDTTKEALSISEGWLSQAKQVYLNLTSERILAYRQLIIDVVDLLGGNPNTTAEHADKIIRFEAQLANISSTVAEKYDSSLINITLAQLQQEVPEFDWSDHFNKLIAPNTIPESELIFVPSLPYLKKTMKMINTTSKRILANYMVWDVMRSDIKWLSEPFRKARLKYLNKTTGATSVEERWKTCVEEADETFFELIGAAYVNEFHTQFTKPISMAKQIVEEAKQMFKQNVNTLTWLDNATRSEVLQKTDTVNAYIGFPDYMLPNSTKTAKFFERFEDLTMGSETYFKNQVSLLEYRQRRRLKKFRKPIDNTRWQLSPLDGNAAYTFVTNTMTLPAAILQPPVFFPNENLRAYSLGSFGSIVGHEVMHGFGTLGRTYDKDGKRKNWWSNNSLQEFHKRVKCYEKQYSEYKILGKYPINTKDTAEENIADDGSLKIALKMYFKWAKLNPSETWLLPGLDFTNEQLFYIGFAQKFCFMATEKRRNQMNLEESHGDSKFRIIGPLANSCDFTKAFKCKISSPMNPVNKCYLWSKAGQLL